jgi:hypothetical protein
LENKSFDRLDILEKRIKDLEEQVSGKLTYLISGFGKGSV